MSKVAIVTFERSVIIPEVDGMTEDEIKERAVEVWNEYMELDDILMHEDSITHVRTEDE